MAGTWARACEPLRHGESWRTHSASKAGYETLRKSDEQRRAPGAENVRALFNGEPAIILLDELSIYLRKVKGREDAAQLTPFLTVLFKAVESSPGVALVVTLAIGKGNRATDAYGEENEYVAHKLAEAESVAARKAALLDPTSERETVQVLRRRLFSRIDQPGAAEVAESGLSASLVAHSFRSCAVYWQRPRSAPLVASRRRHAS